MGNMVTDAMLEDLVMFQSEESWSDVAISIINGGGIRTSVPPGMLDSSLVQYHCKSSIINNKGTQDRARFTKTKHLTHSNPPPPPTHLSPITSIL